MPIEEFEQRLRAGEIGPETPVERGGRWISAREWPGFAELRAAPERAVGSRWDSRVVPWATMIVVGLCARLHFWWDFVPIGVGDPRLALSRSTAAIFEHGESWRLLTAAFVHADIGHLLSNGTGLVVGGVALEVLCGWRVLLAVLGLSTLAGSLVSSVQLTEGGSVGISGGVFGVLGACAVVGLRFGDMVPRGARAAFGTVAALFTANALYNGLQAEGVDNWAHVGGLVAGLLMGALLHPEIPAWQRRNRLVAGSIAALVGAVLVAVGIGGHRMLPWAAYESDGVMAERPAWWTVQVSRAGLRGYASPDRQSAVSLATRKGGVPASAEGAFTAELERVQRLDPAARLLSHQEPDRAEIRYRADETDRVVHLRVATRGLYTTVGAIDVATDARLDPLLLERSLDGWSLTDTPALRKARAEAASSFWKARLEAAVSLAEFGEEDAAARLFGEARELSGGRVEVDVDELKTWKALGSPRFAAAAEAALGRFPDDPRIGALVAPGG